MYVLNIARAIKKRSANEIRDFTFEKYYKRIEFSKKNKYYSMNYSVINSKKTLILAMLKNTINHLKEKLNQPKKKYLSTKNPNTVDIKSVITEHPKTLHRSSTTIRQAEKVVSNNSLYSEIKK